MTQTELEREERKVGVGVTQMEGSLRQPAVAVANVLAIIEVDPEDLLVDQDLKALRSWTGSAKHELSIPSLAQMIYEEGQDSPCLVRPTEDGLMIVAGHRRQEAALLIRKDLDDSWQLKVIVEELTEDQALRKALSENIQREDFTRVERGRIHQLVRKRFGWVGKEGTRKVAEFVGLSPATVAQDEKLLGADKETLDKILADRMTVTAALDWMVGNKDKQPEVLARAEEIAQEKASKKAAKKNGKAKDQERAGQVDVKVAPPAVGESSDAGKEQGSSSEFESQPVHQEEVKDDKPKPSPKVESSHVRQAQREVPGALDKPRSMKMTEAIGLMEQWTGPAYPKVMGRFAAAFVDRAHGKLKGGDKELEARWDDIADVLSGKKPRVETKGKPVGKPVKKAMVPKAKKAAKSVKKAAAKTSKPKVETKPKSKAAAKKPAKPSIKTAKVKAKGHTEKLVVVSASASAVK